LGVLDSLPAMTISAKAATLGAAAAKGSLTAKVAAAGGMLGAVFAPLVGCAGLWAGYRMSVDSAKSDKERAFAVASYKRLIAPIFGFFLAAGLVMFGGGLLMKVSTSLFVGLVIVLVLAYIAAMWLYGLWCYRARRKCLAEMTPAEVATQPRNAVWEYRSRFELLGLPFVHIRMGDRMAEPLKAWIAVGDCAVGVLFAFGGLAIAPISFGGCSVGLLGFGGLALAPIAVGGVGVGVWSFSGMALGWQAFGGCAIAWNAAWGGYAIAHDFALGGLARAAQTDPETVKQILHGNFFFKASNAVLPYLLVLNLAWLIPLLIQWRVVSAKIRRPRDAAC